jgi:pyridoxal phosphate enzyme (YggS family)
MTVPVPPEVPPDRRSAEPPDVTTLPDRIDQVLARIDAAAERSGRNGTDVLVLLATKTRTPQEIADAVAHLEARGRRVAVGENRAQEIAKYDDPLLADLDVPRHFIGRLQRNKARDVVAFASVVQSVDRIEIAQALEQRAAAADVTREVLIQVNTSGEETKGGFAPQVADLVPVLEMLTASAHLRPVGLMTIGANTTEETTVRASLRGLRELRDALALPTLTELSMGMSADLEIAVEEGASIVRVGSAVFGPRPTA